VKALVIGCGRVGSSVAKNLHSSGWSVSVVDETEEALGRLGDSWAGDFHVGHGMDAHVLEDAGIEGADAVVIATDGDNTNIVVAQVARLRYEVPNVSVRILDPARAEFYTGRGFEIVSPTRTAIDELTRSVLESAGP
jgi:trk system potassium uptake protein